MKKILELIPLLVMALVLAPAAAQSQVKFEGGEAYVNPVDIVLKDVCRPEWPLSSLRNSEVGTVDIMLLVNTEGVVTRTKLVTTSGFRDLDRATMRGLIGCKFKPVHKDGVVVE